MEASAYYRAKQDSEEATAFRASLEEMGRKDGLHLASLYTDDPQATEQSGYETLLRSLRQRAHGFQVVLVPHWEQLAKEPLQAARSVLGLEAVGALVRLLDDQSQDTLETVLDFWRHRRAERGSRVRQGMERRALQGRSLGRSPFGYRIGPSGRLTPVPQEAQTVRLIFQLYLRQGMGLRLLARHLNEGGLQTRLGRPWSIVAVRSILRNRAYLGTYDRFGVRIAQAHPPLVSPEDFRRVQQRLARPTRGDRPAQPGHFLLSELAVCGACGNSMIGVSRRQRWRLRDGQVQERTYRYYQCQSRRNLSLCQYRTRRAEALEGEVLAHLRQQQELLPPGAGRAEVRGPASAEQLLRRYIRQTAEGQMSLSSLRQLSFPLLQESEATAVADPRPLWRERLAHWDQLLATEKRALLLQLVEQVSVQDSEILVRMRQ